MNCNHNKKPATDKADVFGIQRIFESENVDVSVTNAVSSLLRLVAAKDENAIRILDKNLGIIDHKGVLITVDQSDYKQVVFFSKKIDL